MSYGGIMKKLMCSAIVASIGISVNTGVKSAQADRGYHNAAECLSVYPVGWGSEALIWRGAFGFTYYENVSRGVYCPIRIDAVGNINPTGGRVRVYEVSTTGDIRCTPDFIDDGIQFTLATRYTCTADQNNGCLAPSVAGWQDGYLTWGDVDYPAGNRSGKMSAGFNCTIGPANGTYMQVSSYELTY
jgi:hypothetical protein